MKAKEEKRQGFLNKLLARLKGESVIGVTENKGVVALHFDKEVFSTDKFTLSPVKSKTSDLPKTIGVQLADPRGKDERPNLKDLSLYHPRKVIDKKYLLEDFLTLLRWHNKQMSERLQDHQIPSLEKKALEVVLELHKRGAKFNQVNIPKPSQPLFDKIKRSLAVKGIFLKTYQPKKAKRLRRFSKMAAVQIQELENQAIISGLAIAEGELTGMDAKPTWFSGEMIERTWHQQVGERIIFIHGERKGDVIGHIERVKSGHGKGWIDRGVVWDKQAIEILMHSKAKGEKWGFSVELYPEVEFDQTNKREDVIEPHWKGVAIVLNPALKISQVNVKLEKQKPKSEAELRMFIQNNYAAGWSTIRLAEELELPKTKIFELMDQYGIGRRTQSQAAKTRWDGARTMPLRAYVLGTGSTTERNERILNKDCSCPQCLELKESGLTKMLTPSLLLRTGDLDLVVDAGEDIMLQLSRLSAQPQAVLITHAHREHTAGLKNFRSDQMSIYASKETWESLKGERIEGNKLTFQDNEPFTIGDLIITPIRVKHSSDAPTHAFKIKQDKTILYSPNISEAPDDKDLEGVDMYIGDGTSLSDGVISNFDGHASMMEQIHWCEDAAIPLIKFTNVGHLQKTFKQASTAISKKNRHASILKDGDILETSYSLCGLRLSDKQAYQVSTGHQKIILSTVNYEEFGREVMYLLGDKVYALTVLGLAEGPVPTEQIKGELAKLHNLSDEQWNSEFGDVEELYVYRPKIVKKFNPAKPYDNSLKKEFYDQVEFEH